jgi:hypothetical protein
LKSACAPSGGKTTDPTLKSYGLPRKRRDAEDAAAARLHAVMP